MLQVCFVKQDQSQYCQHEDRGLHPFALLNWGPGYSAQVAQGLCSPLCPALGSQIFRIQGQNLSFCHSRGRVKAYSTTVEVL